MDSTSPGNEVSYCKLVLVLLLQC